MDPQYAIVLVRPTDNLSAGEILRERGPPTALIARFTLETRWTVRCACLVAGSNGRLDEEGCAEALSECIRKVAAYRKLRSMYVHLQLVDDASVGLVQGSFKTLRACLIQGCNDCGIAPYTAEGGSADFDRATYSFYAQSGTLRDAFRECPKGWWRDETVLNALDRIPYDPMTTYPPYGDIFTVFRRLPPKRVRVVILGQDPYINQGEAMGIAFSVPRGIRVPPSLRNIFSELKREGFRVADTSVGDLSRWVDQGVFLCNTALTVTHHSSGSQTEIWSEFTSSILKIVDAAVGPAGYVAMLWGAHAKRYAEMMPSAHVLLTSHPSPLSVGRGFAGCGHFLEANRLLREMGREEVEWSLP